MWHQQKQDLQWRTLSQCWICLTQQHLQPAHLISWL